MSLPVPLNHLLNPQHLAAILEILMTVHLAICLGKCWCEELLLRISDNSELIPLQEGLWIGREILLPQFRLTWKVWWKIQPHLL